jgi:beta-glucosidase
MALARRVIEAAGERPVAVLLTNGRPLALTDLDAIAPSILEVWHLGTEMGPAVADVLFGDYTPGGKLPVTFPAATGQEPLYYNRKRTGRPHDVEGASNKYVSRYIDVPVEPLYPFGHGLSYTTFTYGAPTASAEQIGTSGEVSVSVEVTNSGERAGAEVVQLYVHDEERTTTPPVMELKGFERVELAPGETKIVTFTLAPDDLQFWGPDNAWTVEPGWFTVMVGGSSADTQAVRFELLAD